MGVSLNLETAVERILERQKSGIRLPGDDRRLWQMSNVLANIKGRRLADNGGEDG